MPTSPTGPVCQYRTVWITWPLMLFAERSDSCLTRSQDLQLGVGDDRRPDRVDDPVQPAQVEQHARGHQRAQRGCQEVPLPGAAADVRLRQVLALPDEFQGADTGDRVVAPGHHEPGPDVSQPGRDVVRHGVVHRMAQIDRDPADRVADADESQEADHQVVIDRHAGQRVDRADEQVDAGRAPLVHAAGGVQVAVGVRGVQLVHAVTGDVHVGVARQRDQRRPAAVRRDVHDHHRVGVQAAVRAHLEPVLLGAGHAVPLVVADQQEVRAGEHGVVRLVLARPLGGLAQMVHRDRVHLSHVVHGLPENPDVDEQPGRQRRGHHHRRRGREPARASLHDRGR